jgi:hypothetical protein
MPGFAPRKRVARCAAARRAFGESIFAEKKHKAVRPAGPFVPVSVGRRRAGGASPLAVIGSPACTALPILTIQD